jgi:hypothetical protein
MFSISERWVPGGRGAASTFTIRITDEAAKMNQKECRSNRCCSGKDAINISIGQLAYRAIEAQSKPAAASFS